MALLKLHNITRNFKSGVVTVEALKAINMEVEKGEFVSIMGPSGSGKSTLLNIIGCLDKPTLGTYVLEENQIERLNDAQLSVMRNIFLGFVFQSFNLLPSLDAQANVELPLIYRGIGGRQRRALAEDALISVGLSDRKRHKPSQLSGGEQQRVAIARALVGNPMIILADEPTGALDSHSGDVIMSIFQKLNEEKGITIIQVTHERRIAQYGQRIVYLLDGAIEKEEKLDRKNLTNKKKKF